MMAAGASSRAATPFDSGCDSGSGSTSATGSGIRFGLGRGGGQAGGGSGSTSATGSGSASAPARPRARSGSGSTRPPAPARLGSGSGSTSATGSARLGLRLGLDLGHRLQPLAPARAHRLRLDLGHRLGRLGLRLDLGSTGSGSGSGSAPAPTRLGLGGPEAGAAAGAAAAAPTRRAGPAGCRTTRRTSRSPGSRPRMPHTSSFTLPCWSPGPAARPAIAGPVSGRSCSHRPIRAGISPRLRPARPAPARQRSRPESGDLVPSGRGHLGQRLAHHLERLGFAELATQLGRAGSRRKVRHSASSCTCTAGSVRRCSLRMIWPTRSIGVGS